MADNYLEKHYEDYLKRKAAWEKTKGRRYISNKHFPPQEQEREDEAL